ncbi:dentin sialophosphoprotein isoform X1 [Anopheles gambiae]|uniref:dentin sialophosphoprotein isoform X1 n=1 Tax=Anopheles gambiae TaxID=7165 RepID=UPI002AC8B341|nr:dentin sialophosphoprotein isoform X1 [Anopheles gambiae]XP_061519235.1 dentin sialophosphoprotein isoform X1 [Anopheles gambiae]XP_061519237.1 dentin sialophosphoprotein isoform X1 [Anopheles gambiae]XP_061519239.1 dentin sialophosphoprotein isoform X1 [Anopheles gambiae]
MKFLLVTAVICGALALTLGVPVPAANPDPAPEPAPQPKTDIELMKIPLDGDKELDVITLVNSEDQKINERNKRTIGILRELFPTISQILDQKIQMITSYLFRTIGPILLRSGLGLSGGTGGGNNNGGSSSGDDDDDFDFDDDDDSEDSGKDSGKPKVSISLPTFPPSDDTDDQATTGAPSLRLGDSDDRNEVRKRATVTAATATESANDRIDLLAGQFGEATSTGEPAADAAPTTAAPTTTSATESNLITTNENANTLEGLDLAGLSDTLNAIRVARATGEEKAASSNDQNAAESSANSSSLDELTLDSEGNDEDRNKRFLSFGGSSGGGGSGNFLFDIIRRAADRAARAAGTVYRVVAGTESLTTALETDDSNDDGHSTSSSATSHSHSPLVSGSSGTEQSDEKAHSPDDHDLGKGDGYTEGIPGPVTRLFVLANRGLSNLIQDLILRIAQTSERVVNFKARLITSLI